MTKALVLFCSAVLLFNGIVSAQSDTLVLNGTLSIQKGSTYKYALVLGPGKEKWMGYSILDKGGPNETRSTVVANFVKSKSSMLFTEKALLGSKVTSSDFCFVGGMLKYEEKKGRLKGIFFGKDDQAKICGTGTVSFAVPEAAVKLLTPDGQVDTNMNTVITRLKEERFTVSNSSVQLQLWDGGVQDHDSLSITLNNEVLQDAFEIKTEKKLLTLNLKKGKNILKIKALNEGTEAPNSARIAVIDGGKKYALVSFLKKGEEAKVIIEY